MVLPISTTKFFIAETSSGDYNFHRWTCKTTEYYSVNSKPTCKPPELHTIMKKCNGTGLVLKICETKNNVWKKYELSIQNGIDNCTEIIKIKPDFASLNKVKTAGSQCLCGFPFSVLAKCLRFLVAVGILNDEINYCICYMTNSESNSRYQSDNIFSIYCKKNECTTRWYCQ